MKDSKEKTKQKKEKKYLRVGQKLVEWKDIFTLLKLSKKKRTKKENRRVETFLKEKAKMDALCTNECKICGKKIPAPCSFCSSQHWREYNGNT